jgi:PST family polysaccharide transporter
MGGAQGLNYVVGLVRIKIIAVILGPAGVGLVSLYTSAIGLIGVLSGMGIASSGVREVAQSFSQKDEATAARTVLVLRRACWVTGLAGWALTIALAQPLSYWVIGSPDHTTSIAILGFTLLLTSLSTGQIALLQGMRHIGDIARISVATMLCNTGLAIGLYSWLGQRGILPVMVSSAVVSLVVSWWFVRRIHLTVVFLSLAETFAGMRRLAGLGLAAMWSALLTVALDIFTRSYIARELGINDAGLFQAAWALSGMFAGFILSAMGTDFYPRLTNVITDKNEAGRIVNEQTEIGLLLALPGLLGTLAFAPWILSIFYSKEFLPAAALLPWFVLGVFGRVISWPLAYIQLANGSARMFAFTETLTICLQIVLNFFTINKYGLIGVAYSFAITYFCYTLVMLWMGRVLIQFRWSCGVKRLLWIASVLVVTGIFIRLSMLGWRGYVLGGGVTLLGTLICISGLTARLKINNAIVSMLYKIPGYKYLTILVTVEPR